MAEVSIPNLFLPGFRNLAKLPDPAFQSLCKELKKIPDGTSPKKLELKITEKIQVPGIRDVVRAIMSIANLMLIWEKTESELAAELALAFSEKTNEKKDTQILKKRIELLFKNFGALRKIFKAIDLVSEVDKIYKKGRVLTDVRLIFNEKIEDGNRSALIIHQLKIEYVQGGNTKEFFVSLDKADLESLKNQITRAIEKEEVIRKDYSNVVLFSDVTD